MKDHVIICGLGHIGFRCFELFQQMGMRVAVISDAAPDDWKQRVEQSGGIYIPGDARSNRLLLQAGIRDAASILAVTDQDMVNIEASVDARRLNPSVRIVCRLFDTNLGKHISNAFNISQIFSASELAAPAFASMHDEPDVLARSAFRGTRFTLDTAAGENGIAVGALEPALYVHPDSRPLRPAGNLASFLSHYLLRPALWRFWRIIGLLAVVVAISSMVVKTNMGLAWIDAFYFVTTTVTTVGYGDINFLSASPSMKIFGIFLMLLGATSLAVLFSTVTETLLSEKWSSLFGGRSTPRKDHVIVVGANHVGNRVVELLVENQVPVVAIENDGSGRFSGDVKRRIAIVEGDARHADTLRRANVNTAKAILVLADSDTGNLSVGLSTQHLNPDLTTVVRVFDADLGEKLQRKLSINKILSVSRVAAPYFVAATLVDEVVTAVRWGDQLLYLSGGKDRNHAVGSIRIPGTEGPLHVGAVRLAPPAAPSGLS